MKNILFLVGSLRRDSLNMRLARVAAQNLPEGYQATFFDLKDVPMYNDDLRGEHSPEGVQRLREALRSTDGVFWTAPEYNFALPGIVKNALDWASRPTVASPQFRGSAHERRRGDDLGHEWHSFVERSQAQSGAVAADSR
jgi:NAD(P)H-dependent FMN reductase